MRTALKIFTVLFFLLDSQAHKCIHDQVPVNLTFTKDVDRNQTQDGAGRLLQDNYQPIRIFVDYTNLIDGNDELREYIQNQLLPSAVSYYQATLKVVQTQDVLTLNSQPQCGGLDIPDYLVNDGVAADLIFLVTSGEEQDANYVAYSSPCSLSVFNNRPTLGMLSFNLAQMTTASTSDLEQNLSTVLHEMMHVLGFSSNLYQYYINPSTGAPLPFPVGYATFSTAFSYAMIRTKVVNGETINYINLDPVVTRVRSYFNCPTLEGGYLENNGGQGTAGSHWEKRTFMNEYMIADTIPDPVITEFTLSILEGSGWYQVNYNVEPFNWGKGNGCPFLDGACISNTTFQSNFDEFCSPLSQQGCTFTARSIGVCGAIQPYSTNPALISSLNYFDNFTIVDDIFVDNCPYFIAVPSVDCEDTTGQAYISIEQEVHGPTSRCFSGTLAPQGYSAFGQLSYCFPVNCAQNNAGFTLTITVGDQTITCAEEGPTSVNGLNGELQCPDPNTFCMRSNPLYCRKGCSGRGTCVNNQCQCPDGWSGDDCAIRNFVKTCARCQGQSSNNTVCFGDLCTCDPDSPTCAGVHFVGTASTYTPTTTGRKHTGSVLLSATSGILLMLLFTIF